MNINILPFKTVYKRFDDYILYQSSKSERQMPLHENMERFLYRLPYTVKNYFYELFENIAKLYLEMDNNYDSTFDIFKDFDEIINRYSRVCPYKEVLAFRYYSSKSKYNDFISYFVAYYNDYVINNSHETFDEVDFRSKLKLFELDVPGVYSKIDYEKLDHIVSDLLDHVENFVKYKDETTILRNFACLCLTLSLIFNFSCVNEKYPYFRASDSRIMKIIYRLMKKSALVYLINDQNMPSDTIIEDSTFIFPVIVDLYSTQSDTYMLKFLEAYGYYFETNNKDKLLLKNHYPEMYLEQYIEYGKPNSYSYSSLDKRCANIKMINTTLDKISRSSGKEQIKFLKDVVTKKRKITDTMVYSCTQFRSQLNLMFFNSLKFDTPGDKTELLNDMSDILATTLNRIKISTVTFDKLLATVKYHWKVNDNWLVTVLAEKLNQEYCTEILRLYMSH